MTAPIVGIDLGTTNSCAAVADSDGNVTIIPYRGGEVTVPSIYAVDDKGNELVGYEAKRQWQLNPKRTIYGSKRLMGLPFDSDLVARMRDQYSYELLEGPKRDVMIRLGQKTLQVNEVAAKILSKIRDVASEHLKQPVTQAVVTVPAYYNDRQRQSVRKAGGIAGIEILRIINEPTAAAIAFGARELKQEKQNVAVYDLGGGTFDISIIEIRGRVFEVKATGGDIFLGGIDFDNALIEYVLSDFMGKSHVQLANDPVAMQRIRDMAERVKIDLSGRLEVPLTVPFIAMTPDGKPLDISMTIRREDMEMLVEHLVERTYTTCASVLDDAKLDPEQIDEVILVGGQTRMPMIQDRITKFFGKIPSKRVHPDEAVAIGAALYAWSLADKSTAKYQLLDVLPMAIGIERAGGNMHRLFNRNSSVPNQRKVTFTTHRENQKDLAMRLYQGDQNVARENVLLGEFVFSGLRPGAAGSVRVEVVFDVSSEGILALKAHDRDSGQQMEQVVRYSQDSESST